MTDQGKSRIVAGRRIIDENHGCYLAGYDINMSINNESTVLENDASMIDDTMVRKWTKDGLSAKEIREKQMENVRRVHAAAQSNLERQTHGVREFKDLLEIYDKQATKKNDNIFAVPALPMNKNVSIVENSFERTTNLGRVGLSCSTPIAGNSSMRVLRTLDISHVLTAENNRKSGHQVFPIPTESSEGQKPHGTTIEKKDQLVAEVSESSCSPPMNTNSPMRTFTIDSNSLQSTFIKERAEVIVKDNPVAAEVADLSGSHPITTNSSMKTFTIDSEPLQSTFVKESEAVIEKEVPVVEEVLQGGKKTRKVNLEERQKRNESMSKSNSLLLTSMMEDAPSPGAKLFNMKKKKMRPTVEIPILKSPPKQRNVNRLSTESDKERSIQMLTIGESTDVESAASSYIDPSLVNNGSTIHSIPEEDEEIEEAPEREKERAASVLPPTPRHESPFVIKSLPIPAKDEEMKVTKEKEKQSADSVSVQTPRHESQFVIEASSISYKDEEMRMSQEKEKQRPVSMSPQIPTIHESPFMMEPSSIPEEDEEMEVTPERETRSPEPVLPRTPIYMSPFAMESIVEEGENEEAAETIQRRYDDTQEDVMESDQESDGGGPSNGRQTRGKKKIVGLRLAKRKIIKPEEVDGLRRSTRTRCKPLRSWLGEKGIYVDSPHGGRRLKGVTDVVITDKRYCKYRTADPKLATERQMKERAHKKARAVERRRKLAEQHRRGQNLNMTQEEIVTSDDE